MRILVHFKRASWRLCLLIYLGCPLIQFAIVFVMLVAMSGGLSEFCMNSSSWVLIDWKLYQNFSDIYTVGMYQSRAWTCVAILAVCLCWSSLQGVQAGAGEQEITNPVEGKFAYVLLSFAILRFLHSWYAAALVVWGIQFVVQVCYRSFRIRNMSCLFVLIGRFN